MTFWDFHINYYVCYNVPNIVGNLSLPSFGNYFNSYNWLLQVINNFLCAGYLFYDFFPFITQHIILDVNSWIIITAFTGMANTLCNSPEIVFNDPVFLLSYVYAIKFNRYMLTGLITSVVMYLYYSGLVITSNKNQSYFGVTNYTFLDEVEQEMGQVEDLTTYVVLFCFFVLWFYFFCFFIRFFFFNYITIFMVFYIFLLTVCFVVPLNTLTSAGLALFHYISGCGSGKFLSFECFLDFTSISVLVIRLVVQNMSFAFVFLAYFEYFEFINFDIGSSLIDFLNDSLIFSQNIMLITEFFVNALLFVYYEVHLFFTYFTQLAIYFILSFWVFFFLYTVHVSPPFETYFLNNSILS